jgi:hypothetical protein
VNKFKDARDEKWLRHTIELALEFVGRRRRSARDAAFDVVGAALKEFLRSPWNVPSGTVFLLPYNPFTAAISALM